MGIDCEKMLALRLTWLAAMTQAMFQSITEKGIKQGSNPSQLNYGVSVTDVDGKEGYELVVAGYDGPNLVLKWDKATRQLENIAVDDPRVSLTTDSGWMQTRVIDAGSGYLCQMEPVAHFGLGREVPVKLEVLFPDGRWMTKDLTSSDVNKVIKVKYSKSESSVAISNNYVSKSRSNLLESSVGTNWKSMELKSPASKIQPSEITFTLSALYCLAKLR